MRSIPLTLPLLVAALACGREAPGRPVDSSGVRTAAGVEVGMAEADVRSRYPVGLRVQPHKYDPKGRYLVVQGTAPADSARRLIFETDGQRVVRYRAGITPAVEYVEGCA